MTSARFGGLFARGIHEVRPPEKLAVALGAYFVAVILLLAALTIQGGGDLARSSGFQAHAGAISILGGTAVVSSGYCWFVSWTLIREDGGLSDRAGKLWRFFLVVLNHPAGVAYILTRQARRVAGD